MLKPNVLSCCISIVIAVSLSGCATKRQIAVDYPKTEAMPLKPLKGQAGVGADDYYVQLVSEFDFKGDNALKAGCSDVSTGYENGDLSAAVVYNIQNEPLRFRREASGFLYQATTGKCNFRFETKKTTLTPWLRLDGGKDTRVDYSVLTSNNSSANLSKLIGDINTASNLLMFTGVGTGVAIMGKVANNWVENNPQVSNRPSNAGQFSTETFTLPAAVNLADGATLNRSKMAVFEVLEGGLNFGSEPRLLGELKVYPEIRPSLLLKQTSDGIPDAHDLSLEELLRIPMYSPQGEMPLQQLIGQLDYADKPNLQPDWQSYGDLETQCRKLKLVMKDLGFNKFDRNAVLHYFLNKSADWKNYNLSGQKAMNDEIRPKLLEQYRSKDFSGCLAKEDYGVMKAMNLPVNTDGDWDAILSSRQKKEGAISPVQSAARQLLVALNNPNKDEAARQLYPLLNADKAGAGSVLLQNHLGNFGLEGLLQLPSIAPEGVVVNAAQLANVFAGLTVDSYSCARPVQEQGQPLANIGILLFITKPGSPREKGGALEFELNQGKITRLAFQHPSFRDFEQNLLDYPDLAGCRIEADFLNRLH